jgi:DDE superfamily endonuclease
VFKSEDFLNDNADYVTSILGEVKIACTIWMLAGASYLDLFLSYGISIMSIYSIFHEGVHWINSAFQFPLVQHLLLVDTTALRDISESFASCSGGVFMGCIGALDGMAVRIWSPNKERDGVTDPGNYYCRKGFFALNFQAICDSHNRIIWISTGHKGSSHDSKAFSETKLSDILNEKREYLYSNRFFIVGDSAYPLASYMIVPFANAESNSMEDAFNYWQSSTRIHIECAFGEVVMRWGILWRRIIFNLQSVGPIINACCHLHNFLVDERLSSNNHSEDFESLRNLM